LKLLLDEMYPSFIAVELRARGHDALSVHEAPGRGTPDDELFEHARSDGRAIVTENIRDYRLVVERRTTRQTGFVHSACLRLA
jgi:predicted nuclease of predicted toxin-antitoxin system